MSSNSGQQTSEQIQICLTPQQKNIINRAAQIQEKTLANFILEKSCEAATEILVNQTLFSLSDEAWEEFCDALESPPKDIPSLKQLLTEPSVFDA